VSGAELATEDDFFVRFWGVRGSIACPGPDTVKYGGNTSCLEIRCGERLLIFDAGTGLRALGNHLAPEAPVDADLFLTHTHFDHVCGLPFFGPAYAKGNSFRLWAGHLLPDDNLRHVLREMMMDPLFPVPLDILDAEIRFNDFHCGEEHEPGPGIRVKTRPLNHPNSACGYRVEFAGNTICYVTDTEHVDGQLNDQILELIDGADIFIYDATYTDDEYPNFRGWGHSTWQEGVRLANAAGAKTYVIFHHDPSHTDDVMDRIQEEAQAMRPGTVVAREGLVLRP